VSAEAIIVSTARLIDVFILVTESLARRNISGGELYAAWEAAKQAGVELDVEPFKLKADQAQVEANAAINPPPDDG
jgi:hypothetical protein